MKLLIFAPLLLLSACQKPSATTTPAVPASAAVAEKQAADDGKSVLRVNTTIQDWNPGQPWEKNPSRNRRALGALVEGHRVLTTAEMVADATFIELESTDGTRHAVAEVACVDYEANLALLKIANAEDEEKFFAGLTMLEVAEPPPLKETLEIIQVEDNGQTLVTPGQILSAEVVSTFLPGQLFLTYRVKASMQSSASSYSVPVFNKHKLAGILSSYDSKDQICDVIATPLLARFIAESKKESYQGFPNLGISFAQTEDLHFRQWLKIPDDQGGIFITKVRKNSAADAAKLQKGDVVLAIDGHAIDRRGYYTDPQYDSLHWVQLVRGTKSAGDALKFDILRDGETMEITATLTRQEESSRLVPFYTFGKAPNFLIKGGMIFQELTRPLLQAFGKEWESRAPLPFLDALSNPEKYQDDHERMICLTGVIPTQATVGYEGLRNLLISKINGVEVRNMKDVLAAFQKPKLGSTSHSIEFLDEDLTIQLDDELSNLIDKSLLQRGLSKLSRAE